MNNPNFGNYLLVWKSADGVMILKELEGKEKAVSRRQEILKDPMIDNHTVVLWHQCDVLKGDEITRIIPNIKPMLA